MTRQFLKVFASLLFAGAAWSAQETQITLKWSELAPRITGKKVALVLPGGASVQGKVRGVEPNGLRLDISKTFRQARPTQGTQHHPQTVGVRPAAHRVP